MMLLKGAKNKQKSFPLILAVLVPLLVASAAQADSIISNVGPVPLNGAPGLFGSALVEVSIFESTPTGGIIDFAVTNTSPLIELAAGRFANAFITEFQFDLPEGCQPVYGDSSVIALPGVRFAQGAGNPVIATDIERMLDWDFGVGTGGGWLGRAFEADLNRNDNAIFSDNALDPSGIPVEDYARGFLNNGRHGWEGGVFDTITFRLVVEAPAPLTENDLEFFEDSMTLKFQGGGDGSVWAASQAAGHLPEPDTIIIMMAAGGVLAVMAGFARRKPAIKSNPAGPLAYKV